MNEPTDFLYWSYMYSGSELPKMHAAVRSKNIATIKVRNCFTGTLPSLIKMYVPIENVKQDYLTDGKVDLTAMILKASTTGSQNCEQLSVLLTPVMVADMII